MENRGGVAHNGINGSLLGEAAKVARNQGHEHREVGAVGPGQAHAGEAAPLGVSGKLPDESRSND